MASLTSRYAEAKTGVFWDIEDCPVLNGQTPASTYEHIKSALVKQGYHGEVSIQAYKEKQSNRKDFELAGIDLKIAGKKHGRSRIMFLDWLVWMNGNPESNVLIISRDKTNYTTFTPEWEARGFNILFAEPGDPPERCCKCRVALDKPHITQEERIMGSEEWVWTSLAIGGDPITKTKK